MRRRQFVQMTAGALPGAALVSMAPSLAAGSRGSPSGTVRLDAPAFRAARRFADTRFGRIAYVERGRGQAALCLHGFPLNGFQWRGAIERLERHRRCIAPDFLALGYTEVAEGQSVAPDAQVEMLVALLDTLGVAKADVIASDSGGAVAQLLLVRHPARVRTLLLTNCDTEIDSPPPALVPVIEMSRAGTFADSWLGAWLEDKPLARTRDAIGGACYADPGNPTDEAIETYFAPLVASARSKALVHAYALALEKNPLAGVQAALRRSTAPARVVWGLADTIFSPESPDYLDRSFGNSKGVRRLPGSKLFWPEERPDVVAEEALALWRQA